MALNGRIPATVVVPVRNEERNLPLCLERLSRFQSVVVVDSNSSDATPEIARRFGASLIQFEWNGRFPKKRNWVLLNHAFETDWVLFLDADEVLDDRCCEEIDDAIRSDAHDGYWLNYSNYFLDRKLKHGLPQRKLALFRIGRGLYERIEEASWSNLDMEVHEHPVIDGRIGEIKAEIEHRDFRGLAKFLERHIQYAQWEARRTLLLEAGGQAKGGALTARQRYKYGNVERWWYPAAYFAYSYVLRLGFLDGPAGLAYAFYKSWYFRSIQLLLKEYRAEAARA